MLLSLGRCAPILSADSVEMHGSRFALGIKVEVAALTDGHVSQDADRLGEQHQDEQQRHVAVGTTKKSAAISCCMWFAKKVRQVCEGRGRWRTM